MFFVYLSIYKIKGQRCMFCVGLPYNAWAVKKLKVGGRAYHNSESTYLSRTILANPIIIS